MKFQIKKSSCKRNTVIYCLLAICNPINAAETKLSTQLFANFSDFQVARQTSDREGWQLDLKRFYLDLDHNFNADWKLKITSDVQWLRQQSPTDLWFRHAYIQRSFNQGHYLKLGVAELPWIDYIARRVGFRYIDPSLTPKNQLASPTDPGIHYGYKGLHFSYGIAAVTGGGFKKPRVGDGVDLEAAAIWHLNERFDLAFGLYQGTRTLDKGIAPKYHTARRYDLAFSYLYKDARFGVEYAYNDNWRQVNQIPEDASNGWSTWGSYSFSPKYAAFVRYDITKPNRRLNPSLERIYYQLGVDYKVTPYLTMAFVAKQNKSSGSGPKSKQNEIGIWTLWNF